MPDPHLETPGFAANVVFKALVCRGVVVFSPWMRKRLNEVKRRTTSSNQFDGIKNFSSNRSIKATLSMASKPMTALAFKADSKDCIAGASCSGAKVRRA
jgi:hypothetical protein